MLEDSRLFIFEVIHTRGPFECILTMERKLSGKFSISSLLTRKKLSIARAKCNFRCLGLGDGN
jgi:hypothetical protein